MRLDQNDIIVEPLINEKSTLLAGQGKYLFRVHKDANKPRIVEAIENLYGVKVADCNTLNMKGKKRRTGRNVYTYTAGWKKAIITLKEGAFDFFETLQ
jgi:large subunit ribosomal protein L23